jgi:CCR4-NOT transcription complex subunit 3
MCLPIFAELEDLVEAFDNVMECVAGSQDGDVVVRRLENSREFLPVSSDTDARKSYTPKNYCDVLSSFPQFPLTLLINPQMVWKLDLDTLFFIFYYQQVTYAQYLATKELKEKSWRFYKRYVTWFQRHEQPK